MFEGLFGAVTRRFSAPMGVHLWCLCAAADRERDASLRTAEEVCAAALFAGYWWIVFGIVATDVGEPIGR